MKKVLLTFILCLTMALTCVSTVFGDGYAIDGDFSEWEDKPHTTLSYNDYDDDKSDTSYGAVAQVGNIFYAHVHAEGSGTLSHNGKDMTDFWFFVNGNDNWDYGVGPRYFVLNEDGTIDWSSPHPEMKELGQYHYYIAITETNIEQYKTIDELKADHKYIGEAIISIEEGIHRVELSIDVNEVVQYINNDPSRSTTNLDASTISMTSIRFGTNIGPQVMSASGTPTGAVIGAITCASIAGCSYYYVDKKRKFH